MNFKNRVVKFEEEKNEIEDLINRGINKFNNINNKYVQTIETYIEDLCSSDTPLAYVCKEEGIGMTWFDNVGSCGSKYYEDKYQLIPYAYFEEDEDINKINADIEARKAKKARIKEAKKNEMIANLERVSLEKEIKELSTLSAKYDIPLEDKISELKVELTKTKADLERQKNKIKEMENEL